MFNAGLANIKANGTYDEILAKYLANFALSAQKGQQSRTAVPDAPVSPFGFPFDKISAKIAHSSHTPRTQFCLKFPWRCRRRRHMSAVGDRS